MQKLSDLKEEIDSYTIAAGDFTISLSITDRTAGQKIHKEIEDLTAALNQKKAERDALANSLEDK